MYALLGILLFLEVYGIAMGLLERRFGNKRFWLCFIPFLAFRFVDARLKGFRVMTIHVKSLFVTMILMGLIALGAFFVSRWGEGRFPPEASGPLTQLMAVPMGFAAFVAWVCIAQTSSDLLFLFHHEFPCDLLVCLILLPVPVLFTVIAFSKEKRV